MKSGSDAWNVHKESRPCLNFCLNGLHFVLRVTPIFGFPERSIGS
jgi:hypothetical protein